MKLLACVGGEDRAARSVLATTGALAAALHADAEALHVGDAPPDGAGELAREAGVPLRVEHGDPVTTIARAVDDPAVSIAVVGIRDDGGPAAGGHVALAVIARSSKPVVVVPPRGAMTKLDRLLVPLDGPTDPRALTVVTADLVAGARVTIVALHVFDAAHAPPIFDRPEHDIDVWAGESSSGTRPIGARSSNCGRATRERASWTWPTPSAWTSSRLRGTRTCRRGTQG